jgi:hypothetical protein
MKSCGCKKTKVRKEIELATNDRRSPFASQNQLEVGIIVVSNDVAELAWY